MSLVIPNAYALTLAASPDGNRPVIGIENLATADTLTADEEDADYPATNLANPATNQVWKSGSTAAQKVRSVFAEGHEIDYVAIARHNLGSGACSVSIEALTAGGDPDDDGDWVEVVPEVLPGDDSPILFRFDGDTYGGVRLPLSPGSVEPQIAVLYTGKLVVLEKGIQTGFTPITYGRKPNIMNPRSQGGDFLGRIVLGGTLATEAKIINISPDWYRSTLDAAIAAMDETPFFWAWAPEDYPDEVGFVWTVQDTMPLVAQTNGRINLTLSLEGIIS